VVVAESRLLPPSFLRKSFRSNTFGQLDDGAEEDGDSVLERYGDVDEALLRVFDLEGELAWRDGDSGHRMLSVFRERLGLRLIVLMLAEQEVVGMPMIIVDS
jgi:hypothetical protein